MNVLRWMSVSQSPSPGDPSVSPPPLGDSSTYPSLDPSHPNATSKDWWDNGGRYYGMENFGNTCFANAILQSLYHCEPFRSSLLGHPSASIKSQSLPSPANSSSSTANQPNPQNEHHTQSENSANDDQSPTLLSTLRDLFDEIASSPQSIGTVSPHAFMSQLRKQNELYRSTMHQDAHEFLNYLLNTIAEEAAKSSSSTLSSSHSIKGKRPQTPSLTWVHELFQGTLTNEMKCLSCERTTSRDESFLDLSIDIDSNSSITACLRQFSASEMLRSGNKFSCDSCCSLQEAEKRMKIKKLPRILALHLKRFKYQEDLQRYTKLSHRVVFPRNLRLFNVVDDCDDGDRLYNLWAVVIHIGSSPHHGHYVAIVKSAPDLWLLYNDETITPINSSELEKYFGDAPGVGSGYVLFFQAVESSPQYITDQPQQDSAGTGMMGQNDLLPNGSPPSESRVKDEGSPTDAVVPSGMVASPFQSPLGSDQGGINNNHQSAATDSRNQAVASTPAPSVKASFLSSLRPSTAQSKSDENTRSNEPKTSLTKKRRSSLSGIPENKDKANKEQTTSTSGGNGSGNGSGSWISAFRPRRDKNKEKENKNGKSSKDYKDQADQSPCVPAVNTTSAGALSAMNNDDDSYRLAVDGDGHEQVHNAASVSSFVSGDVHSVGQSNPSLVAPASSQTTSLGQVTFVDTGIENGTAKEFTSSSQPGHREERSSVSSTRSTKKSPSTASLSHSFGDNTANSSSSSSTTNPNNDNNNNNEGNKTAKQPSTAIPFLPKNTTDNTLRTNPTEPKKKSRFSLKRNKKTSVTSVSIPSTFPDVSSVTASTCTTNSVQTTRPSTASVGGSTMKAGDLDGMSSSPRPSTAGPEPVAGSLKDDEKSAGKLGGKRTRHLSMRGAMGSGSVAPRLETIPSVPINEQQSVTGNSEVSKSFTKLPEETSRKEQQQKIAKDGGGSGSNSNNSPRRFTSGPSRIHKKLSFGSGFKGSS